MTALSRVQRICTCHCNVLRCFHDFLKLILNHLKYCIIGEITRLFFNYFHFSKYFVLYFTHHFEKYVFYRNFEKYNAYVLLIYGRDTKPTATNKQSWRCVLRNCIGRMKTVDGNLLSCTQEHNHSPDLADCEAKTVLSTIKEMATTSTRICIQSRDRR
jgi:hypothetical protein